MLLSILLSSNDIGLGLDLDTQGRDLGYGGRCLMV